ncbi:hypothetical protein K501DRAFT_280561 [Backusella circina FSU 941]|nr:hypothetical protein K501DRAFT_280561 [Backusella circina FSU 941]
MGNTVATVNLARIYYSGSINIPRDYIKARDLIFHGPDQGYLWSEFSTVQLYYGEGKVVGDIIFDIDMILIKVFSRFGIMVPNLIIISMNSDNVKFNTNKSYSDSIGVEKSINYLYYNSDSNSVKS